MSTAHISHEPDDLTIRVLVDDDLTLRLWDIRVTSRDMSSTLAFPKRANVQKTLVMPLGLQVGRCLSDYLYGGFHRQDTALEVPDFKLQLKGAALSGLRIERARGVPKSRVYAMHFKHFVGRVDSLFSSDRAIAKDTLSHVDRVAVSTLVDIAGPLFGLARMSGEARDEAARFLQRAGDEADPSPAIGQGRPVRLEHCLEQLATLQDQVGEIERHLRLLTDFALQTEERSQAQAALEKSVHHPDTLRDHVAAVAASPNVLPLRPRVKDS